MRNNHAAIFRRSLLLMFAAVLLSACLFGGCSTEDAAIVRQGMPLAELKEAADKILLDAPTCCIVQIGDTIAAVSTSGTTAEHFALFDSGTGAMRPLQWPRSGILQRRADPIDRHRGRTRTRGTIRNRIRSRKRTLYPRLPDRECKADYTGM